MFPNSEHFSYKQIHEGVWAAIVKPSGLAASNSGIVDLGGEALIFDTTFSPASAGELTTAAESLPGIQKIHVINSHWHTDHVFGNAVFPPETKIHAAEQTRKAMAENIPGEMTQFKNHWPAQLMEWSNKAKEAKDEAEKADYEEGVRFAQAIIDTFPKLELRLPDKTFTDKIIFEGTKRKAELLTFGGGHTESDALLYLPVERIAIMGDLLVVKNHPDLRSGNPHKWLEILNKVRALEPVQLIPGHGEIASLSELEILERYIRDMIQIAGQNSETSKIEAPAYAKDWGNEDAFPHNLEFLRGSI